MLCKRRNPAGFAGKGGQRRRAVSAAVETSDDSNITTRARGKPFQQWDFLS